MTGPMEQRISLRRKGQWIEASAQPQVVPSPNP